jgi:hypothetical protein
MHTFNTINLKIDEPVNHKKNYKRYLNIKLESWSFY